MHSQLFICTLLFSDGLAQSLTKILGDRHYAVTQFQSQDSFLDFIDREQQEIDCLVIESYSELKSLLTQLQENGILIPVVILDPENSSEPSGGEQEISVDPSAEAPSSQLYHPAMLQVAIAQVEKIGVFIDQAINQFLALSHPLEPESLPSENLQLDPQKSLILQQQRLAEKLRERLGYLGVYYKRSPHNFFRNMTRAERQDFLRQLRVSYRDIVLNYFSKDPTLNEKLDNFVNTAFFADISVSQIVEIHMELMDEFSKHLKLEGRSEEILLDYRLTLIDTIAHLCEMYRRSIPRES